MTLDCYGANERPLDDVKFINELLNKLVYKLQIKPIEPPHLLPYYYGTVKEDIGVSGKMLLLGGHVTIHTFPLRTCYFVDIFYDGDFEEQDVIDFFDRMASNWDADMIKNDCVIEKILDNTQKRMQRASEELDKLVGTRTRQIQRTLKNVESLPDDSVLAALPEDNHV
mgnify:CR=1 FL=1